MSDASTRDDAARLAALEAQQESTRSQLLGIDRKVDQGFGEVREAIDKLRVSFQQEIDAQRERSKAPVWQIVSAIMTTVTILLVVFGMVQANNNEDHTNLEKALVVVEERTAKQVDRAELQFERVTDSVYRLYLEPTFDEIKGDVETLEDRLRSIEMTRSTESERRQLQDKVESVVERVSRLEAVP